MGRIVLLDNSRHILRDPLNRINLSIMPRIVPFRVHQVEENRVVDEVIRFVVVQGAGWGREVETVGFGGGFDLVVGAGEAVQFRVEF